MKMPSPAGIDRPFPNVPASDRYLAIGSIEEARCRICKMIDRNEGLGVIIGPPGTGKTLLCQRLAAQYRTTHTVVSLGDIRVSSRTGLIQQVLLQLRLPQQGLDEQAMQLALLENLAKGNDGARSLLLLIDEAQMLSLELLDEIRMLTNLVRDGRPMVQTVLIGSPRLEDPLADPQLESLSQRIAARCYLHPMTLAESSQYIRSMLAATSMRVDDGAIATVHHACGGVPRLINQLMNHSLDFAALRHQRVVDDICVQQAWADLQQLPSPVLEPRLKPQREIEFGDLDAEEMPRSGCKNQPAVTASSDQHTESFDFSNCTQVDSARYADIEAILASPIVCLPESTPMAPRTAQPATAQPHSTQAAATGAASASAAHKQVRSANREELFGIDFSDELLVDVKLRDPVVNKAKSTIIKPPRVEPAAEEISLHTEILQMSQSASEAREHRPTSPRASLPWAPAPKIAEQTIEPLPTQSADIAVPMAIVWSDDEPGPIAADDRDILVIEDEVSVIVDPPSGGLIGTAAMRQPAAQVDQQYQSLFSRLRTGQ